jgi:hypothetical protein
VHANASDRCNLSYEQIAREILAEAEEVDRAEDERYGDQRGDELPTELYGPRFIPTSRGSYATGPPVRAARSHQLRRGLGGRTATLPGLHLRCRAAPLRVGCAR